VLYDPRSLKKGLILEICSVMMSTNFYVVWQIYAEYFYLGDFWENFVPKIISISVVFFTNGFLSLKRAGSNVFFCVVANFLHFEKTMFYHKFLYVKKCPQKRKKVQKFVNICYNYVQHERVLKVFLLSYFEYCQIWLNILTTIAAPQKERNSLKNCQNLSQLHTTWKGA
jgi:hypothetical protein